MTHPHPSGSDWLDSLRDYLVANGLRDGEYMVPGVSGAQPTAKEFLDYWCPIVIDWHSSHLAAQLDSLKVKHAAEMSVLDQEIMSLKARLAAETQAAEVRGAIEEVERLVDVGGEDIKVRAWSAQYRKRRLAELRQREGKQ